MGYSILRLCYWIFSCVFLG